MSTIKWLQRKNPNRKSSCFLFYRFLVKIDCKLKSRSSRSFSTKRELMKPIPDRFRDENKIVSIIPAKHPNSGIMYKCYRIRTITVAIVNKNDGKRIIDFLMSFRDFEELSFFLVPLGITFCALSF